MQQSFSGKLIVITGAASGIGLATARRFAAMGATVVAADIDEAGGADLERELAGAVTFHRCDVTRVPEIQGLMGYAGGLSGGIDVLFNNAGANGTMSAIDALEPDAWDVTMALLLRSVAFGIRYAVPYMKDRKGSSIVNTSSMAGHRPELGPATYSVAKAAVLHLTRRAASDLARFQIRVNSVSPGFIPTSIMLGGKAMDGADRQRALARLREIGARTQPVARAGQVEDIAAAVTFLASDEASFMTGTDLLVDGGNTLGGRRAWDPAAPSPLASFDD